MLNLFLIRDRRLIQFKEQGFLIWIQVLLGDCHSIQNASCARDISMCVYFMNEVRLRLILDSLR